MVLEEEPWGFERRLDVNGDSAARALESLLEVNLEVPGFIEHPRLLERLVHPSSSHYLMKGSLFEGLNLALVNFGAR